MANNIYGATALTGAGAGALDAIDGTGLADKDMALVTIAGTTYNYILDADLNLATSSPSIIQPATNPGTKDWVLTNIYGLAITAGKTVTATQSITLDMAGNLSDLLMQFYGVTWDESADTYARTGTTAGQALGVTLANAFLSVQRRMRGCLLSDAGAVNYYLSATDWTLKESQQQAIGIIYTDGTIPSDGDTVTLDTKIYTFKTDLTPTEGEVLIGGSAAIALDNLKSAINHTGTPDTDYKCAAAHTTCTATDNANTYQNVQAILYGNVGNTYALAVSDANMSVSAATLTGGAKESNLTGADGQVMVQIPKFWYRYGYAGTTHTWEVSPVPLAGFDPHPAFYKDGAWVDYRYIGAYEGVLYDTSLTAYVDGIYQTAVSCVFATADDSMTIATRSNWATNLTVGQKIVISGTTNNNGTKTVATLVSGTKITVAENLTDETAASTVIATEKDYTATTGDKLCSVSGKAAINYTTRAQFRVLALNRGTGWRQQDYDLVAAIQLLFLTEYASFYSQSVLGAGISAVTDWSAYNDYNPIALSGNGNAIGNASGNNAGSTSAATESTKYLKYRGIENFYGHLWKFVDGFNINNNIPYRTNVGTNFADDTTTNYTRMVNALGLDVTLHNADGYVATIQKMKWGFLAASVGASGSTKITDYYYQSTDWRVALFCGNATDGVLDGFASWSLHYASSGASRDVVGRLGF